MNRLAPLPRIMVAPNGARRRPTDHAALPVTIPQIVADAAACHAAGAGAIHAHVRDAEARHVLDAGLYAELITEMGRQVPGMAVQITTEAADVYTPSQQRAVLRQLHPEGVSIALAEMLADGDRAAARASYHALSEAGVAVQHILYAPDQAIWLAQEIANGTIPAENLTVLYVLGRYSAGQISDPAMLPPFLDAAAKAGLVPDWALCAFGRAETPCLRAALAQGGKARVGFENNFDMEDGRRARDNASRVAEIAACLPEPLGPHT